MVLYSQMDDCSAKTLRDVIKKHQPDFSIERPTNRKYMLHLLRSNKLFKNITIEECVEFETQNKIEWEILSDQIKEKMFEWIKDKKLCKFKF